MNFPKDAVVKVVTRLHRAVFDLSQGRLAGKTSGMPVVKLTTIGRKSGQRRATMLTSPLIDGDKVILVASFGGDDRNPAWFGNLVANPEVEVVMSGSTKTMRARVAGGDERTALWEALTAKTHELRGIPAQDPVADPCRGARAPVVARGIELDSADRFGRRALVAVAEILNRGRFADLPIGAVEVQRLLLAAR